ncbi:nucleolar protein 12-domain-containing protein [Scleroderma citrinum]
MEKEGNEGSAQGKDCYLSLGDPISMTPSLRESPNRRQVHLSSMQPTNAAILTQSHSAIAAKKRKKNGQVKEVIFDEDARRDFLTGFHKRKVAKKEEAKKRAKLREKQERQELRREHRRALAERAARNATEIEKAYGATIDQEGAGDDASDLNEMGEEYEGEEQLATVTVVEDFDPATLLHEPLQNSRDHKPTPPLVSIVKGKDKEKARHDNPVTKKHPKVKYQTRAARAAERAKQRARHTAKAERAGGKASRIRKR